MNHAMGMEQPWWTWTFATVALTTSRLSVGRSPLSALRPEKRDRRVQVDHAVQPEQDVRPDRRAAAAGADSAR
jgi:hypothetical protein